MAVIYDLADAQRASLANLERQAFDRLARSYVNAYEDIKDAYGDYANRLRAWQAAHPGESLDSSPARHYAFQQVRLQDMMKVISERLVLLADVANGITRDAQAAAWQAAGDDFRQAWGAQYERGGAGAAGSMGKPPDGALESLVGFLGDGSPLKQRLMRNSEEAAFKASLTLQKGLVLGWNANKTATHLERDLAEPHWKALRITRTETARAYRESARLHMLANAKYIKGWRWRAAGDVRTCATCYAMHGSLHPVDWVPKGDEPPSGRAQHKGLSDTFRAIEPTPNPSQPPPAAGGSKASRTVARVEAANRANPYETLTVVDKSGAITDELKGGAASVDFDDAFQARMKGKTMTHNHPRGWQYPPDDPRHAGNGFSIDDLRTAIESELAEIRAVTPTHTHSLKPGRGGPWRPSQWDQVRRRYAEIETEVRRQFYDDIFTGRKTQAQAEAAHHTEIMRRLAEEYGWEYVQVMA